MYHKKILVTRCKDKVKKNDLLFTDNKFVKILIFIVYRQ